MKKAVRLDKFLADAGAGTRSEVKKYIQKGKVQVNSVPVKKPEIKVSEEDEVVLDGNRISQAPEFVYYLLHKPAGYVSATEDKRDKTVMELVASDRKGLFPVGRLDKDTEGLLLITDDGALAHELLSPKKHVDKTYYAVTDGCMTKEDVQRFADGLEIGEKIPQCRQNWRFSVQEKLKRQNWNSTRQDGHQKFSLRSKRGNSIRSSE